ncbi:hypothetical protein PG994_006287 [Apiospora phragmitis]|uniref:Ubiquinol-cytochrome C reductase hinge domain-containing protein n=1 Tax=Apiospora phragmitis TaxID=2905665 RepID=A0ABR1VEM8_9PEZI
MGIWETFTDLVDAATPWSIAEAEAPAQEEQEPKNDESKEEESSDDDEEEEEEDEDEIVDPKETLEEELQAMLPAKHHFDECVERVTKQEEDGDAKEDCVEEFFHLAHCASQCAAPKLWSQLK